MSKTFMYLLVTIGVFLVVVKGLSSIDSGESSDKTDSNTDTLDNGMNANTDENGVSQGASGQQRYRIDVPYSNKVQQESYKNKQDDLKDKIKSDLSYTM